MFCKYTGDTWEVYQHFLEEKNPTFSGLDNEMKWFVFASSSCGMNCERFLK